MTLEPRLLMHCAVVLACVLGFAGLQLGSTDSKLVAATMYSSSTVGSRESVDTCVLRYRLSGQIRVRDTTLSKGNYDLPADGNRNGFKPKIKGQLILRLETSNGKVVESGKAELLYFDLHQYVRTGGGALVPDVTTDVWSYAPDPRGYTKNDQAIAVGTVFNGGKALSFPDCTLPSGWNKSKGAYTPSVHASGKGCIEAWRNVGNVHCADGACKMGGMRNGDNAQNDTWNQPLPDIILGEGFATFAFAKKRSASAEPGFMQLPNNNDARTYMRWTGKLDAAASTCDDL